MQSRQFPTPLPGNPGSATFLGSTPGAGFGRETYGATPGAGRQPETLAANPLLGGGGALVETAFRPDGGMTPLRGLSLGDPSSIEGRTIKAVDFSMSAGVRWAGELIAYLRETRTQLEADDDLAIRIGVLISDLRSIREIAMESWKWLETPVDRAEGET